MAGECGRARRDILLAVLIALSVAVAFVMDTGLEGRVHQALRRTAPRVAPRDHPGWADPPAEMSDADSPTGMTSLHETLTGR